MTVIVVMGVSGVGKTSVGRALARRLGVPFLEGDELHPPSSVAKMSAGTPLAESDRVPWLAAIAHRIEAAVTEGTGLVVACSALRRSHRDVLRGGVAGDVLFVHLVSSQELLRRRLEGREGHFMPASLLDSQLVTLEPPGPEEHAIQIDAGRSIDAIVERLANELSRPTQDHE
jgi:carbohydrate kinase (thermoresistant glucokinase family)